jgi:hypothetical protein
VTVVRPDERQMRAGQLAKTLQQELDPLVRPRRSRSRPSPLGISSDRGNPFPRTTTCSSRTPHATISRRSCSEVATTAAAPAGTCLAIVLSKARFARTLRTRGLNMPSGSNT